MANTANGDAQILQRVADSFGTTKPSDLIDSVSKLSALGSLSNINQLALRGLNHRGSGNPIRLNRDNSGIVLFTRPYMNLTYDNIKTERLLTPLLTELPFTLQRYIRCILDPKSNKGYNVESRDYVKTDLVDPNNPFIPLLTNNLLSVSGWPDIVLDTHTSSEGILKESWTIADGTHLVNRRFDLTANFRNIDGDPITAMFFTWIVYMSLVKLGVLTAYPQSIANNRRDYNTAVWHLILDPSRRYVTKIARTIGLPTTCPMGGNFNFSGDQVYSQTNEQLSFNFACDGATYNDPILFEEFNRLVGMYNPSLRFVEGGIGNDGTFTTVADAAAESDYIRLRPGELEEGNYFGIPMIHPMTNELFWYVSREEYNIIKRGVL